jgi:hypothetical protein
MPNWCQNDVTFRHKDPKMLERVKLGFYGEGLFKEFFPTPQELVTTVSPPASEEIALENFAKFGAKDWYDWNVQNWGTKWDVTANEDMECVDAMEDYVRLAFDSAWSPPIEFFAKMSEELDFEIEAFYWEPGMDFCGRWTTESGDESYEGEDIPSEIDEVFGISEAKAAWGLDNEEEEV